MSKRTLVEVAAEGDSTASNEALPRKKSRKERTNEEATPAVTTNTSTDRADVEEKPKKRKSKSKETSEVSTPVNTTSEEDVKAAKAARKAAKRAHKEAQEAPASAAATPQEDDGDTAMAEGHDAKAVAKAARKAEKARLKALKKEQKKSGVNTPASETTATDAVISNRTSAAASKAQSSATSPEPTPAPTGASSGYTEDSRLSALPQSEIDAFLASNFITITDPLSSSPKYRPITSFSYLPVTDEAQRAPFAAFASPTPIQAAAWPPLLAGRDVIGVAETGSGKTLAFGVPCIRYITSLPQKQRRGVKAGMVSPTRELAMQIYEQLVKLATPAGLKVVCVYGGVAKDDQREALKTANIVVATPGRLNDLINEGVANLSNVGYMVLDEADRMLDKGFEEDIRKIIGQTPSKRQTLMFTATWPQSVRELAATFMTSPVKIAIGDNPTGELRANTRITQTVEVVDPRNKEYRLLQLLKQYQSGKNKDDRILVFCLYKKEATRIENFIRSKGFRVAGIHGDLSQTQRTTSLEAFKQGKVPILVATDVAARGLDIPAVMLVINVTFPLTAEDYVHRIGRTGRAGKEGKAITLFTEHDKGLSGS